MAIKKEKYNDGMVSRGRYGMIPNEIWEMKHIGHIAKIIFCYLVSQRENWESGRNNISRNLKIDRETVTKYLKQLQDNGFISIVRGPTQNMDFVINDPRQWTRAENHPANSWAGGKSPGAGGNPPGQGSQPGGETAHTKEYTYEQTDIETIDPSNDLSGHDPQESEGPKGVPNPSKNFSLSDKNPVFGRADSDDRDSGEVDPPGDDLTVDAAVYIESLIEAYPKGWLPRMKSYIAKQVETFGDQIDLARLKAQLRNIFNTDTDKTKNALSKGLTQLDAAYELGMNRFRSGGAPEVTQSEPIRRKGPSIPAEEDDDEISPAYNEWLDANAELKNRKEVEDYKAFLKKTDEEIKKRMKDVRPKQ